MASYWYGHRWCLHGHRHRELCFFQTRSTVGLCLGACMFRIPQRVGVIISLVIFFLFYLMTFPWPFFGHNIAYKHPKTADAGKPHQTSSHTRVLANFSKQSSCIRNSTLELVGCPCNYHWCEWTPPINIVLYFAASSLALGVAIPVGQINLSTLYSKILGPMKQGTMQGIYGAANIAVQIVAPLIIS